jgi:hypothetical protein
MTRSRGLGYVYKRQEYNMGPSTALGVINFGFIMLIVLIYLRVTKATRDQA